MKEAFGLGWSRLVADPEPASESKSADDQGGPEHHDSLRMATQEPTDTTDEAPSTVSFGLLSDGTDTPQHFQRIQGSLVPRF